MRKTFIIAFVVLSITGHSQAVDSILSKYSLDYQPKKVYLHHDKSSYYVGETVWFKAYLMQGLLPAQQSKTLYIDCIADNGSVLSHIVSPIVNASPNGQFEIPADYKGSFIHIRAYTKWMMNFDTAFLYSKNILILQKHSGKTKIPVGIIPSLELFPEGGDIIMGVRNKIAFKARDQFGRPVKIKGRLLDDQGKTIKTFSPLHDGMGSFSFVPKDGINYTIKWTDEKNTSHTSVLPKTKQEGISIQVIEDGTKRLININAGKQLPDNLKQLHLIGTMQQEIAFRNNVNIEAGNSIRRIIPPETLPSGILNITVFDANWKAIAERITFINNNDYSFQPSMVVQHWGLGRRKRNEIEIHLPDSLAGGDLSISVTDEAIEKDTSDNIISHFLLSSDIRGKVYNPAYYFSNNSDSVAQHLDLVMLTHGWRRFNWEDIHKGILPKINYPKDTAYLSLTGKFSALLKIN